MDGRLKSRRRTPAAGRSDIDIPRRKLKRANRRRQDQPSSKARSPKRTWSRTRSTAAIDWGGCRCQAPAITGDATQTDPACALSPRHVELVALAEAVSDREPPAFHYRIMTRSELVEA